MPLAPGIIVMVLEIETHLRAERAMYLSMDQLVIGGRVSPHQLRCGPVLLSSISAEIQPGHVSQL